ncbi:phage/plasmid replication protein, II/X family [Pseudoteredinibacter isoporae]|uniref:II/X family phage/plasmid replication protein n=1 Tax=Pseudoteredinibacter isoporae TaxID=570281 RepID=A0A7X0JX76_9GAMM|nr:phage/plasmid replication protein, II/X family [Pseudoteredinibacter isoporae]MBB6523903.1 II/X family phage/plasmid replication protein [Pseudoteredinibacter isoporae]NHO89402.1 hypothetical protein [Pseudoteredinibacter isoporae]NIB22792.1 hypothetical protein [Pseudoteredinibacter isoporae]
MWDKADIRIPFAFEHVHALSSRHSDSIEGFIRIPDYDFPANCDVAFVDGSKVYAEPTAKKWGSISSGISTVAVGFFPEGNGFYRWPHISVKASPSKILQGHNVFGTENIAHGTAQMIAFVEQAFPKIFAHLDIDRAEIRYLDSTYSAFIPSEYQRDQVIRLLESLFPNKSDISRHVGYLQGNKSSEYHRQKVYYKAQELEHDLDTAKRKNEKERAAILSDRRLHDFAFGRLRFEGTTGTRALERLGIPTNYKQFLKFHNWYEQTHGEPLCRYLWRNCFDKYLAQLEGHTMKNVDDNQIKLKIDAKFISVKANGRVCKRKANAIWRTYRDIKSEGYDQLASENSSTFFRNVKLLESCGLSRAFLKSLDPRKPADNVVPLVQLIKIDFSNQRPNWYEEPVSGFEDRRRHLRAVS